MLRILNILLWASLGTFWISSAVAGAVSGGGGKSIVCRDPQGKIISAETLDLYEAKNIYGLKPRVFSGSLDQVIFTLENDLKNTMDQPEIHLFPLFDRVRKIIKFMPPSVVLKPVDDAAEVALPDKCNLEQLAYYVDDDLLLVSEEIWNSLTLTDQAALIAHEAIYRLERTEGTTNSRRARKIVAHLLANFPFENVRAGLPSEIKTCTARQGDKSTFQFVYFPSDSGEMTKLQFFWFDGKAVFSKTTATIPIKLPWIKNITASCTGIGTDTSCNVAGGESFSNFESTDFITLGIETKTTANTIEKKFYFLTKSGRHYLTCYP